VKPNNIINQLMWEKYPHKFGLMDIDGISRTEYYENGIQYSRMIIYECKYPMELYKIQKQTTPQLRTLLLLNNCIDWKKLDTLSGVYIFVTEYIPKEEYSKLKSLDVYSINNLNKPKWKGMSTDELYNLLSAKEL
jgi:hypothetical protein